MNLEELRSSGRIVFECIAGSYLYNLNTSNSDVDVRGIYIAPPIEYLGLTEPAKQISDKKQDITYYSLKRFFELAATANPNILELLWVPASSVQISSTTMEKLVANRDLFISKKCFHTFSGYAHSQISKASGANKMVNHPEMFEKPVREDFCWIIQVFDENGRRTKTDGTGSIITDFDNSIFPCRPVPLKNTDIDLSEYHVSALEHASNIYRLYHYGNKAKGVFRGDEMLVCESIPKEDEFDCAGLLVYNQNEYEKALQQHHKYKDWLENRNENRWMSQEKGLVQYDSKNLMNCMRLLMSGEHILVQGFPIVRFEGRDKDYLMAIRNGELKYEDIMAEVDKRMARLEGLYKNSETIPHSINVKKIENLYKELT